MMGHLVSEALMTRLDRSLVASKNIYIAGDKGTDENGGGVLIMRVTPKGKIKYDG